MTCSDVSRPRWALRSAPVLLLLLAACATPLPTPPAPPAPPAAFKEGGVWQRAQPALAASAVPEAWWQLFNDPVLDDLQRQLVIGNENLKAALAQVANARALVQASQTAVFPTLSVTAGSTRSSSPASNGGSRSTATSHSLVATAGWETDLWGRLSLAAQGANFSLQASQDDLAAARLSAQATLAQTYLAMRAAEAQQALLERTLVANQKSLDLTQARQAAGVVALSDVLQAQTQLKTVQAQVQESRVQRAQYEHAIAVLLGQPPSALTIAPTATLPALPPVPALLPSTLLQRRPDIASAERKVAAAYAQIGVADAAFYPDLTLSASAGFKGAALGSLLSAPNLLWSLGPSLAASVFDGGAKRLASDQARASADQATAVYRQTVLTAFQEVEDNLVVVDQLDTELQLQTDALAAAQRTLAITQEQYRAGTVSYLNVVTAQTTALGAEATLLTLRNRQLAAANLLLKNIGGRW
jgi:NodT family efflux transporter outer membrane factor (OMF) lipoprotein